MMDGETLARSLPESPSVANGSGPIARLDANLVLELRRFVLGVVRDPAMADDVIQSTFVKVVEHGHEARPETARGWLFRVAFHEALAARRREAARDKGHRRLAGFRPIAGASPDDPMIRRETVAAVRLAMDRLPVEQRKVVLARVYEDKTFAEIAKESGLPLGTVLTRMRRALQKMRTILDPGD